MAPLCLIKFSMVKVRAISALFLFLHREFIEPTYVILATVKVPNNYL